MRPESRSKRRYVLLGVFAAVVLLFLFGIPTALIPTPYFTRMIPATYLDYTFLALITGLAGAYLSLSLYKVKESAKATGSAFLGAIGGIFAFGCPICNALLVSLLGVSTLLSFYLPLRPVIGLTSIGLLATALYLKARRPGCATCAEDESGTKEAFEGSSGE